MQDEADFPMEMDPGQARGILVENSSCILLDVRELKERTLCFIEGSLHVPLSSLPEQLTALNPETPIISYCHHGIRSLAAVRMLRAKGFDKVSSMRGGIDLWAIEIDPSLTRY